MCNIKIIFLFNGWYSGVGWVHSTTNQVEVAYSNDVPFQYASGYP